MLSTPLLKGCGASAVVRSGHADQRGGVYLEGHEDFVFPDVQPMQSVLSCYPHQDL
jgi:hypothetical protein